LSRTEVLSTGCERIMEIAVTKLGFSARGYDRILKVARTVADLKGAEDIEPKHANELDLKNFSGDFCR
jgi:magnesium chelatase family protein